MVYSANSIMSRRVQFESLYHQPMSFVKLSDSFFQIFYIKAIWNKFKLGGIWNASMLELEQMGDLREWLFF